MIQVDDGKGTQTMASTIWHLMSVMFLLANGILYYYQQEQDTILTRLCRGYKSSSRQHWL